MIPGDRLPTLEASRVRLRWLRQADVDSVFAIFSDVEVMRYWSTTPLADVTAAQKLLDDIHYAFHRRTLFQWGVARREDDVVIGTCTLAHLDRDNRRAEVGFALAREHWGRGLMAEALRRLFEFGFGELGLHRIEADVDPDNRASIRLVERLGFRREGHLRERWLVGGQARDSLYYGLLADEWAARGG